MKKKKNCKDPNFQSAPLWWNGFFFHLFNFTKLNKNKSYNIAGFFSHNFQKLTARMQAGSWGFQFTFKYNREREWNTVLPRHPSYCIDHTCQYHRTLFYGRPIRDLLQHQRGTSVQKIKVDYSALTQINLCEVVVNGKGWIVFVNFWYYSFSVKCLNINYQINVIYYIWICYHISLKSFCSPQKEFPT